MFEKIKDWFSKEVEVFGINQARFKWLSIITLLGVFFLSLAFLPSVVNMGVRGDFSFFIYGFLGILLILCLYVLVIVISPSHEIFLIFAIIVSAITFAVEKYTLNSEVFPPFTLRTVISLYISYFFLIIGIFYKKLPIPFLSPLPAIYLFGAFVCSSFILSLLPVMVFAWILIPFMGLGFLPYSPLIATSAFILATKNSYQRIQSSSHSSSKNFANISLVLVFLFLFFYSFWYFIEWNRNSHLLAEEPKTVIGHENIYAELPTWVRSGMRLSKNHVTEMMLQPKRVSRGFSLFETGKMFDPLAFIVSVVSPDTGKVSDEDRTSILKLLFNYSHDELDRLWSGKSLIVQNISSHVQLYSKEKLAYTETTLEIFNENLGTQEALFTIEAPPGSICTKLSLWIDGKEEPSRLTLKSKAKKAYTDIVGVERRDPSLLEWLPSNKFRLRVFPVGAHEKRTVKVGIVSFLEQENSEFQYNSLRFLGVPFVNTKHQVHVDVFNETEKLDIQGMGIHLREKIVSDAQVRQWTTEEIYNTDWKIRLAGVKYNPPSGSFQIGDRNYTMVSAIRKNEAFSPDIVYLAVDNARSREEWIHIYKEIRKHGYNQVHIVTSEVFQTLDEEKGVRYIKEMNIPLFNLFPFFVIPEDKKNILIVTANHSFSIPWTELKSSQFYKKNENFFTSSNANIYLASLDNDIPEYFKGFEDMGRLVIISRSEKEILEILSKKMVSVPVMNEEVLYFPGLNVSIQKSKSESKQKSGNDLLARLASYRYLLQTLGKSSFDPDSDYPALLKLAEDAYIVSPISSLIVLETENDYKRFGINKNDSELGQSNLKPPGLVPEPEEWFFLMVGIGFIIFVYRIKLISFLKRFVKV